ncbi:MAG TPA: protoheme IX farnesyltransferase, partial [Thermoanaerobaculia bacterium]|nr:protoheme IX farnesyltransferase [Thermoanaerobaculia bacterium]
MVLITTAAGYAAAGHFDAITLAIVMAGVALLAAGTNAMNEYLERDFDAQMQRTAGRPVPSGRISPSHALLFALAAAFLGTSLLAIVNILTSVIGALTFLSYNFVYTPLKRVTPACTVIGAISGAAGPLIGWTAARNSVGIGGALVFAVLFLWQLPHFMAISWTH